MTRDDVETRYVAMFGAVPPAIARRLDTAQMAGRFDAILAIERWRTELLDHNPLPQATQRLVHFAMTLAVGDAGISADHARSALRAGATIADLHGVCETAAVVFGMPGYSRGVAALASALDGLNTMSEPAGLDSV
jgi:4-carboxymuconolactone decarboxylase